MQSPYSEGLARDISRLIASLVRTFNLRPDYTQNVAPGEWSGVVLPRNMSSRNGQRILQGIEIKEIGLDLVFHVGTRDWPATIDLMATVDHGLGEWIDNCADTEFLRDLRLDGRPIECTPSQLLVDPHTWRVDLTATAAAKFAIRRLPNGQHAPLDLNRNGN